MTDKSLSVDNKVHELKFGESFDQKSKVAFHSMRYDFKPASVDTSKEAQVDVEEGHKVTVTLPNIEGSGIAHTVYKGNKRPTPKECVLIIDHEKGTFTLERLSNIIQLKKTRMEGTSKINQGSRPLTPVDYNKQKLSPAKNKNPPTQVSPTVQRESPVVTPVSVEKDNSPIGEISSSSDSEDAGWSSDSDSDNDEQTGTVKAEPSPQHSTKANVNQSRPAIGNTKPAFTSSFSLSKDLELSESGSDSD